MAQTTKPQIKLTYFNIRGRGEFVRLVLEAAGLEYEDNRIEFADWPALKPKTPLGFLPILNIDGKEITQLMAILRALARKFDLYGSNETEMEQIDMMIETVQDLSNDSLRSRAVKDEKEAAKILEEMVKEGYKLHFGRMEKLLEKFKGKDGWAVGTKISLADIFMFHTLELNNVHDKVDHPDYPFMKQNKEAVMAHPKLAKYLAKRPAA